MCLVVQEEEENAYFQGVANGTIQPGLGPFGLAQKPKSSDTTVTANRRPRPSKADEDGLKLCQFCDRKKPLNRFPMRLIMTCRGQAERKLGAHCKKCMIRSAHLRSNGYMRPHAQDLIKCYHQVCLHLTLRSFTSRWSGRARTYAAMILYTLLNVCLAVILEVLIAIYCRSNLAQ
jgi:hypothetical protein